MPSQGDAPASFRPRPTDAEAAARLVRELGLHPVTAQVLVARGTTDPAAARRFLAPGTADLHDPGRLRDVTEATTRIEAAIRDGQRIAIYGDYDVDGVCGTAVLVQVLALLGADVRPFIPHRVADGYGLHGPALQRLRDEGCALVVTVDNGSTRAAEVARAQEAGLDFVVTDHHETGPVLPPCPVVNPKRPDATYPFHSLAGCGVAFKVALALADRMGRTQQSAFRRLLPDLMALVAVGTVADVVPLEDENRSLVALGLRALAATRHPGLRALLQVSRCADRPVRTSDVAFRLGPRINAAGRLASAHRALELLLCEDPDQAAQLAAELDEGNQKRQRIEREQAAEAFVEAERRRDAPALVLSHDGWHPGVIGIVAARVAETFEKPAALITVEGDAARGSARSFTGVRLHEALDQCAAHLLTHGGHAKAAGFTLRPERIEPFREAFLAAVAAQGSAPAGPREVDAELPLDAVSLPLAAEFESLRPFGTGNEEPLLCAFDVRAAGRPRRTGPGDRHLTFYAATDRTSIRAIAFNQADFEPLLQGRFDLAFVLRRRAGPEAVEIHVREIVPRAQTQPRPGIET
ncbi:MAG: single-stranded-DNA-specific exonuclease RecJ [Planctomycetota bacterium]|jgi:single-stranded-DNA-specific exonuclease